MRGDAGRRGRHGAVSSLPGVSGRPVLSGVTDDEVTGEDEVTGAVSAGTRPR
ncbi:hypothetical protein G3I76_74400 [Streptomyces sp. SID11233]|nr:hypothetical protein [Streptomyces sp. SID11233]